MNNENTMKLFNDFSDLYRGKKLPLTQNLMAFGFECGDGWFDLIYELSKKLSEVCPDCVAVQVKEKYGGLRFYTNGCNEQGWNLINEAENKSRKICEQCGKKGKIRGDGWLTCACNKCWKERRII